MARETRFFYWISLSIGISLLGIWLTSCGTTQGSLDDEKAYAKDDAQYRKRYEVTFDADEKPLRYWYHYIVSKIPDGYRVRVFNPDHKTLTEDKTYSTPNLTMLHGPYKSYWDDGSIRSQGMYQYGRKHGMWVESEPGRGKSSSGMYLNQRKEGEWTQLDSNGLVESIYTWHDDQRHGKFFLFDANGQKINEGIYRRDTLIGELFKEPVITAPYLKVCQQNIFGDVQLCSASTLNQNIYLNIKYPSTAREMDIQGSAVIQWDVLQNGRMSNVRVPQGLCKEIEAECMRVIKMNDEWVPAMKDGVPAKSTLSVNVNFRR